ncbi:hypothetical protein [Paraburkholderia sp. BCC1886]|uniref:SbtR family transcriptional regulator n=1 Tax=Paraburkholderia sp. BCC1886 TaxID=2562670 RepID=UPI00391F983E
MYQSEEQARRKQPLARGRNWPYSVRLLPGRAGHTRKQVAAKALHSGDPAFATLPARREERLRPAFRRLFDAALLAGEIRGSVEADDFLDAAATLCMSVNGSQQGQAELLITLLVDGLRYNAGKQE